MKNRTYLKGIFVIFLFSLFIISCNENKPKGDEFSWSPDGKKLAMINLESGELLVIDIEKDQLENITSVDTFSGEKVKIYAPSWSPDGQYLLYSKSSKNALSIYVYSLSKGEKLQIDQITISENEDFNGKTFPGWSPKANRILWVVWNDVVGSQVFSCLPDGSDKKMLTKMIDGMIFPRWSPDGETIAYALYQKPNFPNNGLWQIDANGDQERQLLKANEITRFQWSPDGSQVAVVQEVEKKQDSGEKKPKYQLSVIPTTGGTSTLLAEESDEITRLDWSPDGNQIAYVVDRDDSRELWMIDAISSDKVKANFANLETYFGWVSDSRAIYTIEYPDDIIAETNQEKEKREILEGLRGIKENNMLIVNENSGQKKVDTNIYAFAYNNQTGAIAYFKPVEPSFFSTEIYFPVIQFADGKKAYPARTKKEYVASADELYLNLEFDRALEHLNTYWNDTLNSSDYRSYFNVDMVVQKMEADRDSSQYEMLLAAFQDGTYLKTVLALRKSGKAEKAKWLMDQFNKLALHLVTTEQGKKSIIDENFWSQVGAYSRYNELEAGIKDLDNFLATKGLDSTLIVYANFAQSLLAVENHQYELGFQKIKTTIRYLPEDLAEFDDIKGLLSLSVMKNTSQNDPVIISALQLLVERFPDNDHINEIYAMLGDLYIKIGDQEKALRAYQHAVVDEFDQYEIWDKILEIR